ncbi:MAG: alpha/beta fold hydrolase [Panacagrimonas sp.]
MAFAEVNGARLAWQQMGEGPDLILVHGLAASRAFWFGAATQLQRKHRVTLFDLRGHGYSSRPGRGYRPLDFAEDILGLMDQLGIAHAALVGHSYGGAAALEAAGLAPQRVTHLGLLDTRVTRIQPLLRLHDAPLITEVEKQIAATHPVDWASLPQVGYLFLETAARMRLAGNAPTARDDFSPFGEGRGAARAAQSWLDLLDHTTAREELDQPGMEIEGFKRLSSMPALLMYAEFSRCLRSYEELRTLLPQADAMIVPQAGHFFPISQGPLVVEKLEAFLAAQ